MPLLDRRSVLLASLAAALPTRAKRLSTADMDYARAALAAFLSFDVVTLAPVPYPREAWYAPRKRWRADKLLDFLRDSLPADGDRVLGVCAADISTTKGEHKDWGIMGLGTIGGRACVVSRFRCKKGSRGTLHTRVRLAKVCLHEVGHTLGSDHCPTKGCLMEDARGRVSTVDGERAFCESTRALFRARGHPLVESPQVPWS
jgi:archaemetzincin